MSTPGEITNLGYRAYRYIDTVYSSGDDDYGFTTFVKVVLHEFEVIKETPKGIWIRVPGRKRFVNLGARKKYACLSKLDALESFKRRKMRQIRILETQLRHAKEALGIMGLQVIDCPGRFLGKGKEVQQ